MQGTIDSVLYCFIVAMCHAESLVKSLVKVLVKSLVKNCFSSVVLKNNHVWHGLTSLICIVIQVDSIAGL